MSTVVEYVPKEPAPIMAQDGTFISDNGEIKATFSQDAQGQHVVEFEARGYTIRWIPREIKYIDPDLGLEDIIVSADQSSALFVLRDYHARYDRHFPDVEEWFRVEGGKLKHYFSLRGDQRPPLDILQNPYLAVSGVLEYDPSLSVRSMGMTMSGAFHTSDPIVLVDSAGREVFTLPAIAAWDQSGPPKVQRGTFFVEEIGEGRLEFSVGVPYSWLSSPDVMYPVVIDPTVVVSSAYDTSGNNGRKVVRLNNGTIVAVVLGTGSASGAWYMYKSTDNGNTWSQVTYSGNSSIQGLAIATDGTKVHVLVCIQNQVVQRQGWDFGTNTALPVTTVDNGQTALGTCSLAIDGNGTLHAVWCSKNNNTSLVSFNIRYSKSTDGGNTWATPTQITSENRPGQDFTNPCIVTTSSKQIIFYQYYAGPTSGINHIGYVVSPFSSGMQRNVVYNGGNYQQSAPCAAVDSNDVIHVVWHGTDAADNAKNNVRYAKSTDGGATWSAAAKLTSGNNYDQQYPSITIDKDNKIRVFFQGRSSGSYDQIRKIESSDGGATWSSVTDLTSNTTASATNPQTLWSKFNGNSSDAVRWIYQDNQANAVKYDSIVLNSPPNAPILTPRSNFDATTAQTFQWTFSDPNQGDSQSAYQLQIVDVGTGQTVVDTGKVASTASSYTLPGGTLQNGKQYQWRVTTWDQSGAQGPWSAYSTFYTAAAPTVQITSPAAGGTVPTSSVTVQWSYSDPANNAQQTYQVQLLDANDVVLWDSGQQSDPQGAVRALTVGYSLANNTTYKVRLVVTNSKGVASSAVVNNFSVSYTPPATPTLTAAAQNGYIHLTVTNPAPSGTQPLVSYNDIYRRETGTTNWVRIATNIPNNGTYDDYAAASGKQYDYKVTAVGNNGTSTDSAVASTSITLTGLWIHDVTDPAGTIMQLPYYLDQSSGSGTGQWTPTATSMQFAGRTNPVVEFGEQETYVLTKSAVTLLTSDANWPRLEALLRSKDVLCFRDSRGRCVFGVISGGYQETDVKYGKQVDLVLTQVDYSIEV